MVQRFIIFATTIRNGVHFRKHRVLNVGKGTPICHRVVNGHSLEVDQPPLRSPVPRQ